MLPKKKRGEALHLHPAIEIYTTGKLLVAQRRRTHYCRFRCISRERGAVTVNRTISHDTETTRAGLAYAGSDLRNARRVEAGRSAANDEVSLVDREVVATLASGSQE